MKWEWIIREQIWIFGTGLSTMLFSSVYNNIPYTSLSTQISWPILILKPSLDLSHLIVSETSFLHDLRRYLVYRYTIYLLRLLYGMYQSIYWWSTINEVWCNIPGHSLMKVISHLDKPVYIHGNLLRHWWCIIWQCLNKPTACHEWQVYTILVFYINIIQLHFALLQFTF